jgi:hypothetical protein
MSRNGIAKETARSQHLPSSIAPLPPRARRQNPPPPGSPDVDSRSSPLPGTRSHEAGIEEGPGIEMGDRRNHLQEIVPRVRQGMSSETVLEVQKACPLG